MYFKFTMFWFMLNIFLMISAISQVRGSNKNSTKISHSLHKAKNEPSVLILQDGKGNTYKYIYPNDMDQFSKMSTLGNKNSSTVIHLPPGILKSENASCDTSDSPVDHSYVRIVNSTNSEGPRTTNPKNAITEHKQSLPGSKVDPIVAFVMPKLPGGEPCEEENTAASINENESTETTTIKDCKTEKEEDGNDADDSTVIKSTYGNNYPKDDSNNAQILSQINNVKYRESSNNQQNSQKSCDARNGLILLVENDIKLKLFLNSNGILDKLSLVNSSKNSTIKSMNELSSEDDVTSE
ncbi:uncharacterized protein LOC132950667 [Metopolophium dirhodum]|uniref:uncharacterized protein LOC132950667 n=1 Tax=Metopolophium dirhodum TaxID=44670 RepID=UPI0029900705|nr:uncharacterized protein LOC132950667 [Metopolophium dirhodum]